VFLRAFKTIRHKQPHLYVTILHDAEPPQRFRIYLAQVSSIILCSEKNLKKNLWERTEVTSYSIKFFHKFP